MALIDNCTAYYAMDVNENPQSDSVGSNDLTVNGATYNASGKISACYSFDGNNDEMSRTSAAALSFTTAMSISVWYYPDNLNNVQVITNKKWNYELAVLTNGTVRFYPGTGGGWGTPKTSTDTVTAGQWNHIVVTYNDAANQAIFYINGNSANTTTCNDSLGTNNEKFYVGRDPGSSRIAGDIDELGLWDDTLTPTNASDLYNSGSGLAYPFSATGTNIQINIGDEWKTVDAIQINIGDSWKAVAGMQVNIGDSWKTIF